MPPTSTSRAAQRAAQIETIKTVSRRLIGEKGVAGLSLREVAREMGQVSSALYRYFESRDELLTALILDAYNDLGRAVERADARHATGGGRDRFLAVARAVRTWAKRHPNEYALIYGTPVPNYEAPQLTIEAATRVPRVLGTILNDDRRRHAATRRARVDDTSVRSFLDVDELRGVMPDVAPEEYVRALMAWTHLFGFVSFELFGHYVGSVRNANVMFDRVAHELADLLGLSS